LRRDRCNPGPALKGWARPDAGDYVRATIHLNGFCSVNLCVLRGYHLASVQQEHHKFSPVVGSPSASRRTIKTVSP
jgi:hypothetical protein